MAMSRDSSPQASKVLHSTDIPPLPRSRPSEAHSDTTSCSSHSESDAPLELLDPLDIRFGQQFVRPTFSDKSFVKDAAEQCKVRVSSSNEPGDYVIEFPFPAIRCVMWRPRIQGTHVRSASAHWFAIDNRRLWALQQVAMQYYPAKCVALVHQEPRLPDKKHARKFRNAASGLRVCVGHRFQKPFYEYSWLDQAMKMARFAFLAPVYLIQILFFLIPLKLGMEWQDVPDFVEQVGKHLITAEIFVVLGVAIIICYRSKLDAMLEQHILEKRERKTNVPLPTFAQSCIVGVFMSAMLLPYAKWWISSKVGVVCRMILTAIATFGGYYIMNSEPESQLKGDNDD